MAKSVFLSVLDYNRLIYRHPATTTFKPLDTIVLSVLRFITGDRHDTHHCVLCEKVGWSSF